MKSLLTIVSALFFTMNSLAEEPLWMRYPSISPNGETIAFTYKGDIYTVPSTGGKAVQLTTHPSHDTRPVWSPDGKHLVFASDRSGNFDLFVMPKEGGIPKQLTTHSANEYPETFSDSKHILYSASIQQDALDSQFPSAQFPQVYQVSIDGGRPTLYSSLAMQSLAFNKQGDKLLYQDMKGYEDYWRKHHQSAITRDIWLCTLSTPQSYKKITTFHGEDRNPVWTADGSGFYYLSEEKGSFNIFKQTFSGESPLQITQHTTHPVRFLTSDNNGTLCYSYNGEIYTIK
ncbi:MAG: peptidase S41, partial [Parabacteroides sp.]|nr:peptidase S41 [Parabacteroides sp.]